METARPTERALESSSVVPIRPIESSAASEVSADARADRVDAHGQTLQRMCFRIGDLGLLFPFDAGREVITPPAASRIPNTVSWLRGLANVRGSLIPIIDTAAAFGVVRETKTPPYLLIFGHGETSVGLLIDGLPRLLDIGAAERMSDQPRAPALLESGVAAAYLHGDRIWFDVDPDAFFDTLAAHVAHV